MKKLFISQPMNGKTNEEILAVREKAIKSAERNIGEPVEVIDEEHVINILLNGQDRRSGQGRQRSDAMILCSVNTKTKTLTKMQMATSPSSRKSTPQPRP